jgi:UDP-N-acetylmuramoyl-L-alanyl-D-glutamate--2,6-diaminopimelate ligase
MKLAELLAGIDVVSVSGGGDVDIRGVAYDSRQAGAGFLFVAMRGEVADGNDFVAEAVGNGAAVIVSEREPALDVPWVRVPSARIALAALAARFFGNPTRQLCLVGITGTNGKTTTAHLLESVFEAAGYKVVLLGTTGYRGPGFTQHASLTTPEAPDLERRFREAVEAGGTHAVMEVSSHAIAMNRTWGLEFDVAVFTNLSHEHLDFHGGVEEYFETKRKLFRGLGTSPPPVAIVNHDDPYGRRLSDCGNRACLSYGLEPGAQVFPTTVELDWTGSRASFRTPRGDLDVRSSLLGRTNLYNVAAAVAVGVALKVPEGAITAGIAALAGVPGRCELVTRGQSFKVIVDYAHTDDALRKVLTAVRELTPGRLILVFGAGGERDGGKRRRMGEVAARYSDVQIVTSDNPRREDPDRIIRMVEAGLEAESGNYSSLSDRREAIRAALRQAGPGDTVIIAGKGHETTQVVGAEALPFDDRVVAGELLDEADAAGSC